MYGKSSSKRLERESYFQGLSFFFLFFPIWRKMPRVRTEWKAFSWLGNLFTTLSIARANLNFSFSDHFCLFYWFFSHFFIKLNQKTRDPSRSSNKLARARHSTFLCFFSFCYRIQQQQQQLETVPHTHTHTQLDLDAKNTKIGEAVQTDNRKKRNPDLPSLTCVFVVRPPFFFKQPTNH